MKVLHDMVEQWILYHKFPIICKRILKHLTHLTYTYPKSYELIFNKKCWHIFKKKSYWLISHKEVLEYDPVGIASLANSHICQCVLLRHSTQVRALISKSKSSNDKHNHNHNHIISDNMSLFQVQSSNYNTNCDHKCDQFPLKRILTNNSRPYFDSNLVIFNCSHSDSYVQKHWTF